MFAVVIEKSDCRKGLNLNAAQKAPGEFTWAPVEGDLIGCVCARDQKVRLWEGTESRVAQKAPS
jgi:hypothetical protein